MTPEEHKQLMFALMAQPKDNINEMFNSGMFNEIVLGAIAITMHNMNFTEKQIKDTVEECKGGTFDMYTAEQCRQAYKKL